MIPPNNATYAVTLDETRNIEISESSSNENFSQSIPPIQNEASPIYSHPNPPARLYFTPTILQDEPTEPIKHVLTSIDQNQTSKHQE